MRRQAPRSREKAAWNRGGNSSDAPATETDPLLEASAPAYLQSTQGGSIRARRSSRSPTLNPHFGPGQQRDQMNYPLDPDSSKDIDLHDAYQIVQDPSNRSQASSVGEGSSKGSSSRYVPGNRSPHSARRQNQNEESTDHPPLLEIPEHIYAVRKGALSVLKPLTNTWVSRYLLVNHLMSVSHHLTKFCCH
jgi:hypothetical protein